MTQIKIRGSTQILDNSINAAKLISGFNLPTSQLEDSSKFLLKNSSGDIDINGKLIINSGVPLVDTDIATKGYTLIQH